MLKDRGLAMGAARKVSVDFSSQELQVEQSKHPCMKH